MDEQRMAVLKRKAAGVGLSEREAAELGRLLAEAEGKPYSDAATERERRIAEDRAAAEQSVRRSRGGPLAWLARARPRKDRNRTVPTDAAERGGSRSEGGREKAA